jgi:hypothetical protein
VQRLARLREPWCVVSEADGIAVRDANGVLLAKLSRADDTDRTQDREQDRTDDRLSETETAELARLIAQLPVLSRRPRY